jgi:hypothetical protein
MSNRYSDQELLERVGHIAELERERDAIKAEAIRLRDAITAEAVRLSEVVHSLCSDELVAALVAWRGLSEERREIVLSWVAGACGASPEAMRLLKAAGR